VGREHFVKFLDKEFSGENLKWVCQLFDRLTEDWIVMSYARLCYWLCWTFEFCCQWVSNVDDSELSCAESLYGML
jgi:hypothetical protein